MFFGFAGCQGHIPSILAYQSNNVRIHSKRSVVSALIIGMGKLYSPPERLVLIVLGGLGGIMGSTIFVRREAPRYLTGLWVTTALQLLVIVLISFVSTFFLCHRQEGRRWYFEEASGRLGRFEVYTLA